MALPIICVSGWVIFRVHARAPVCRGTHTPVHVSTRRPGGQFDVRPKHFSVETDFKLHAVRACPSLCGSLRSRVPVTRSLHVAPRCRTHRELPSRHLHAHSPPMIARSCSGLARTRTQKSRTLLRCASQQAPGPHRIQEQRTKSTTPFHADGRLKREPTRLLPAR